MHGVPVKICLAKSGSSAEERRSRSGMGFPGFWADPCGLNGSVGGLLELGTNEIIMQIREFCAVGDRVCIVDAMPSGAARPWERLRGTA